MDDAEADDGEVIVISPLMFEVAKLLIEEDDILEEGVTGNIPIGSLVTITCAKKQKS
jgi:hypothetical protein